MKARLLHYSILVAGFLAPIRPLFAQDCIECTDQETSWMISKGLDCETDTIRMERKCNKSSSWIRNKFCQLSCFKYGNGYEGDICCLESMKPSSHPTSLVTKSPTPAPSPVPTASSNNIIINGSFESGTSPWYKLGPETKIEISTDSFSGAQSVRVSGRTAKWNGVEQNIFGKVIPGLTYTISAHVKLFNVASDATKITIRETFSDGRVEYRGIYGTAIDSSWSVVQGEYSLSASDADNLTNLALYVEGAAAGVSYLVDFVKMEVLGTTSGPTPIPTANPTPSPSSTPTPIPTANPTPRPSSTPTPIPTANPTPSPSSTPTPIPTANPTPSPSSKPTSRPTPIVTPSPTSLPTASSNNIIINGSFEHGTSSWYKKGSLTTLEISTDSYSGAQSVLVSGRTAKWNAVEQNIFGRINPEITYTISAYVKLVNAASDAIKITVRETYSDGTIKYPGIYGTATDASWTVVQGEYRLSASDAGTLVDLAVFVEGPAAGVSYLVDNVVMSQPTPSPTINPTPSPSMGPTSYGQTFAPTAFPPGPYIRASSSSEKVTIPDPAVPDLDQPRTNCPHLQDDLQDWHTLYPNDQIVAGNDVVLPPNTKVLISRTIPKTLGTITIPSSSSLILGTEDTLDDDIHLTLSGITVLGSLTAGSETCRIENTPIAITLVGSRPADIISNPQPTYYKGIAVSGGNLSLHGKRYYRTWTRLARTAHPGDRVLLLQHTVNWEPGQEVLLTTTALRDARDWHENEILTVSRVGVVPAEYSDEVGAVVYLEEEVRKVHVANGGYQAEVGLLTRMIRIEGGEGDSEPSDGDTGGCTDRNIFGYDGVPCPDKELTGFGGHVIIESGGRGYVEGVELYRMGQTNVLGRYPMHFHLLGNGCDDCYFKDSSVHRSYYRCISIHGTHNLTVTENVAYDVTGFCYYLEDGVEEDNTLSFNLISHVHFIGSPAIGSGQRTPLSYQSPTLTLPADVTASGFYITNMHNIIVGNAAAGGWSGFAFPSLYSPLGPHKDWNFRPANRMALTIDGNVAHSTGWWWNHAGAFYFGGSLYYDATGTKLIYNAGRDQSHNRHPCLVDRCQEGDCNSWCGGADRGWNRLSNTKVYAVSNVGINSWSGRMEVVGYETHDVGLALEALESGFWISDMLAECRSGEVLRMPVARANQVRGDGFFWYDTAQEHVITRSTFRNCGVRSEDYDQYDSSATRGCDPGDRMVGCTSGSTVFGFLTHSDEHTPELMQGTRDIEFQDVGRRFKFTWLNPTTVSGRGQNWIDVDGSVSGLNEPTLIGSGFTDAGKWWTVENDIVHDSQGPLIFIKKNNGLHRGLGHIRLHWDDDLHATVGNTACNNNFPLVSCPPVGRIRHHGPLFDAAADPLGGLPVTANPDVVGPVGGFGWLLTLEGGAPRKLTINEVEVHPETPLVLSIYYPLGTTFEITAHAAYCQPSQRYSCAEVFSPVSTPRDVRESEGNVYHFDDATGLLTVRIIQPPQSFAGEPDWKLWDFDDVGKWGSGWALDRFERDGVMLPVKAYGAYLEIVASDCGGTAGVYCQGSAAGSGEPDVCYTEGYEQVAYDKCCDVLDNSKCEYA